MPPKAAIKKFYIYDPGVKTEIGTFRVKTEADGRKVVFMTDGQASHWLVNGSIGKVPLDQVAGSQRAMLHQQSGGRIPRADGRRTKLVRNAIQDPNTMAAALTEGFHPATGTRVTTDNDRARDQEQMRRRRGKVTIEGLR